MIITKPSTLHDRTYDFAYPFGGLKKPAPEGSLRYIWKKTTVLAKIRRFLCGMPDGTVFHGETIKSLPDLIILESKKLPSP
jgi:hypothetical protein